MAHDEPAGQAVQLLLPTTVEYVPGAQSTGTLLVDEQNLPMGQTSHDTVSPPATAYRPAGQAFGPVVGVLQSKPAGQAMHCERSSLLCRPAGHSAQLVTVPPSDAVPSAHGTGAFRGKAHECPTGQSAQAVAPGPLNFPASQAAHVVCFAAEMVPFAHNSGSAVASLHCEPGGHSWHVCVPSAAA